MGDRHIIDVGEIADLLSHQAAAICIELFPKGHHTKGNCIVGNLAGDPGSSLSVHLGGAKPGVWRDFASGEHGDILDLVAQAKFGGDKPEAVKWAKERLGLGGHYDRKKIKRLKSKAKGIAEQTRKQGAAKKESNRRKAFRLWGIEAEPDIRGTPAGDYLTGRGIDLDKCPSLGALRFHPEVYELETGRNMPALLACVTGPDGKFAAVHRHYLDVQPGGRVTKARLNKAKKVLGPYPGGHISICKGASGVPLSKAPDGDRVVICEGIEDALSIAMIMPDRRVLACVTMDGMAKLHLPDAVSDLVIFADNDLHPDALKGFDRVKEAHHGQRPVRIARAPEPYKDANEWLCAIAAQSSSAALPGADRSRAGALSRLPCHGGSGA